MSDRLQFPGWPERAATILIGPAGLGAECWRFAEVEGVRFEYPGQGARARHAAWTLGDMARDIVAGHEGPLDVLGISTGVGVALELLVRHPQRIRSAILICSDTGPAETTAREAEQQADAVLKGGMAAVVEPTLTQWFTPFALRADLPGVRLAREALPNTDPQVWRDGLLAEAKSEPLPTDALKAIKQAVTIVGGMHGRPGSLRHAAQLHALIPISRFEIWPGSAMLHLEQPEFIRAILDKHSMWAPAGRRVEAPLGACVWLNLAQGPFGSAA